MEKKELYTKKIEEYIKASGLDMPEDLTPWSYRWRCYIYSNILPAVFGNYKISDEDIDLTTYLLSKVRDVHACNWVRERLYPVESGTQSFGSIVNVTYKQLIVYLFFNRCMDNKEYVVDDYMLIHAPQLKQYVVGVVDMSEEKVEEKKTYEPKYKLTPKFDFWEPDHYTEFGKIAEQFAGKDNLKFLEIGAFEGRTSVWLLDNVLTGKNSTLACVDIDPPENLEHNLKGHAGKVFLYKAFSYEWFIEELRDGGGIYDLGYVDGDHNAPGVLEDAVLMWRALKTGGIMIFDDYEMQIKDPWFYIMHEEFKDNPRLSFIHPHVAIDAFLNIYRGQYELLFKNYLVGIRKLVDMGGKNLDHGDKELKTLGLGKINSKK